MRVNKINELLGNVKLWRGIAIISGIFSLLICILIIANYVQINRLDPVNTKVINTLVERLNQNPEDEQLRQEIRELDLLVRKAYFTNQWQIRMGGYLMLIGIAVLTISIQLINRATKKLPVVSDQKAEGYVNTQSSTRKWVAISGTSIVIMAIILALLTKSKLEKSFTQASISDAEVQNNTDSGNAGLKEGNNLAEFDSIPQKINERKDSVPASINLAVQNETLKSESLKKDITDNFPTDKELRDNFPNFRGYGGLGISYQRNIPVSWDGSSGNNVRWKVAIPLPGYNSPVVWRNKVFLAGADALKRELYCFDIETGKLLWTATADNIQGSPSATPKVQGDTGFSAPTVTTDGKKVYAIYANGDIIAVDFEGKRVWAKNLGLPQNHYGYSSSLIMHKGLVLVQYDQNKGGRVMALSAQTGDIVWSTPRNTKVSWSSPILAKVGTRFELLLVADPTIASYDPDSGKELWSFECISGEVGPSLAYSNGIAFVLNEYASLVAVKVGSPPEKLWEDTEYLSDVPSPVANENFLFVVTSYGTVVCYDSKTGEKFWSQDFGNGFYSSPIIADGKLYLLDKNGSMHIVKVDKVYAKIGENPLGEKTVTTPAFADGKILIRGDKSLFCIGK